MAAAPQIHAVFTPRTCARYCLYGLPVEISCAVDGIEAEIARVMGPFRVREFAERHGRAAPAAAGVIRAYDQDEVVRRLPADAKRIVSAGVRAELYEKEERFWLIDDRWGMLEVDLLKAQWRAWLLRHARVDAVRLAEMAVLWPMAQVLRPKGLHLLPAASVVRNGMGLLLLSPLGLGAELAALVRSGVRVIGQRWTALRERDGRVEMLHLPGMIEAPHVSRATPSSRLSLPHGRLEAEPPTPSSAADDALCNWLDLADEHCGAEIGRAPCDAVFVIAHGRRTTASLRALDADAIDVLRGGWPIEELHPLRRHGQLANRLAARCTCYEAALSRDPHDLLALLNELPRRGAGIEVTIPLRRSADRARAAVA